MLYSFNKYIQCDTSNLSVKKLVSYYIMAKVITLLVLRTLLTITYVPLLEYFIQQKCVNLMHDYVIRSHVTWES